MSAIPEILSAFIMRITCVILVMTFVKAEQVDKGAVCWSERGLVLLWSQGFEVCQVRWAARGNRRRHTPIQRRGWGGGFVVSSHVTAPVGKTNDHMRLEHCGDMVILCLTVCKQAALNLGIASNISMIMVNKLHFLAIQTITLEQFTCDLFL